MASPRFSSVDDYLASLDPPNGETLRTVIESILEEFPELECKLAWNVPQIHREGKYVFGVSSARNHLSLAPWSVVVLDAFRPRLEEDYVVLKNIFQVPVDWNVDHGLLHDLVRAQLAEMDGS